MYIIYYERLIFQTGNLDNVMGISVNLRAGVCRPCVETELSATKKSVTDGN